jgi:hypothetical protein
MAIHYLQRYDLSKYTLKSFDGADEVCCDTNNGDLLTYDANGTTKVVVDTTSTQTLTNKTISGTIDSDLKVLAATQTFTSNTIAATITGFSWTVVAGATYQFEVNLPITMTTNGGGTVSFKLTTATLTSIQYQTYAATATDNATAVSTNGTTTTDATKVFDSATAAYTHVNIKGSMVINAGGTFAWQACQNTSNTDTTSLLIGSYAILNRAL